MKTKRVLLILGSITLLTALGFVLNAWLSRISFRVMVNDEVMLQCKGGTVTRLHPKPNGGFRLHCGTHASVYVIYGTYPDRPTYGTIDRIEVIDHESGRIQDFLPAFYASHEGVDCPSASALNRTTGEPLLPLTMLGHIKAGTYTLPLAKPCGNLVLEISR